MPGIVVNTSVRSGPSTVNQNPAATFFVVGRTERGEANFPRLLTSLSDYETVFGGFISTGAIHQQVQTFFEEGGAQVFVSRIVGASATAGTIEISGSGNTGTALTLTAVGEGSWSTRLSAAVTSLGGGFQLRLFLDNSLVFTTGEVASSTAAAVRVNSSSLAALFATAVAGPGTLTGSQQDSFSAGDSNESAITDATYISALSDFGEDLGPGAVAIPDDGFYANRFNIHSALISHAATANRIALLAFDYESTVASVESDAAALSTLQNTEYAAAFFPWLEMTTDLGTSLDISPEGFVAAKRSLVHNSTGSFVPYAGLASESRFVTGVSEGINKSAGDELDENRVNAIRIINGRVRIYGARSLSPDEDNFRFITSREMLNFVVDGAKRTLEDLVFSPIDGRRSLFSEVTGRLVALLEPIRVSGGLFEAFDNTGRRIDYGYSVQVTDAINPLSQLAGGLVKARVGVRVSSTADQIQVDVTKSNLTASVV